MKESNRTRVFKRFLPFALTVLVVPALAADGDLDLTFGIGGRVTTDFPGSFDGANALAIQSDGKIVAAGLASFNQGRDFGLSRYNGDGSLDATFGIGGKVTTDFSGRDDFAYALAIQSDGRIVAAGGANSGNHPTIRPIPPELQGSGSDDFGLVRYNTDGSLDTTFGIGGKVTTDFSGRVDFAHALAIQSDGKIVVTGGAYMDALVKEDFAVDRYNTDGSLDTTFGIGGRVTTDLSGWDRAYALAIQSDGKIVVAGEDYGGPISLLARYNGDGSLDMTFGVAGKVLTDFKRWGARQMLWPSKPMARSLQPVGRDLQTTFTQPVVWPATTGMVHRTQLSASEAKSSPMPPLATASWAPQTL